MARIYRTGEIIYGIVTGFQPYGAFVELKDGGTGLVHISEISADYVRNIEDYLKLGEETLFYVIDYDEERAHARLSLKRLRKERRNKRKAALFKRNKKELDKNKDLFPFVSEMVDEILKKEQVHKMLSIDKNYCLRDFDYQDYQSEIDRVDELICKRTGLGGDFLGFLDYAHTFDDKELLRILRLAEEIRGKYDTFVVCGIGGSYLGAKAGIEMLKTPNFTDDIELLFLGNTFSSDYTKNLLEYLESRNFAINVISKSGSTLETAIGFRFLRELLIKKYGKEESRRRIFITTDSEKGELRTLSNREDYTSFVIPDNIQGRYSVFTPVGLFPLAIAGVDIASLLQGVRKAMLDLESKSVQENAAYQYALLRRELAKDKTVELFVSYEPALLYFAEWWKQLFGESEGKEGKGLFPASAIYSTDLHSLGQFVQDGNKTLFETMLLFDESAELAIPKLSDGQSVLNGLEGRDLSFLNKIVSEATIKAHNLGGVPIILLRYPKRDAFGFGYLCYFFMFSIVASAYLIGVNPCDQEAVEVYKKEIKKLLSED